MRVLHVFNYAWPWIDGYVVRSVGLTAAQRGTLGYHTHHAVSPFKPLAKGRDEDFVLPTWGPGEQTRVEASREPGGLQPTGLERPGLGVAPLTNREYRRGLEALIEQHRPDVVHAHHPSYNARPAMDVARRMDVPGVYELRCFNGDYDLGNGAYADARGRWINRLELDCCRAASAVVTIGDKLAERITASGKTAAVVRNAVDTELFKPKPSVVNRTLTVGYATTFERMENLDAMIDAAAELKAAGFPVRVKLAGAGRDWDRIAALRVERGVEDVVELPGFVPYGQMPDWYRSLDLFVVPRGRSELTKDTTPLKPLEALACGVPVLCSDLPAMRELLGKMGDAVRFVEPTGGDIAREVRAFTDAPWSARRVDLGERAWSSEVRKYERVYGELL